MTNELPAQYFTIDFPHLARFTHYPSGDTCLRHQWMLGNTGSAAWHEKISEFFARHPDCHLLVSEYSRKPIDDIRTYPAAGGGFEIGDEVVAAGILRRIVARNETGKDWDTDLGHQFILEDGAILRWHADSDGWFTNDSTPAGIGCRARPLFPGEQFEPSAPAP